MYENFCMRMHDKTRIDLADSNSWTLEIGAGDFASYHVESVHDEAPDPKKDTVDIPGTNGVYDQTEAAGRVTFGNKKVVCQICGVTTEDEMAALWSATLSLIHGHVVDFTFDAAESVSWIRKGRVSIAMDYKLHRITFTIDTEPFAVSTTATYVNVPVSANANSSGSFAYDRATGGYLTGFNNTQNTFAVTTSDVGTTLIYKRSGLTPGDVYTLGIKYAVGGNIAFQNWPGGANKTKGIVDENGYLEIRITTDGSYYEWQDVNYVEEEVDNSLFCYPAFKCEFILCKAASAGIISLPSNVLLHPDVTNLTYPGTLIMDGAVFDITDTNNAILYPPGAILPGIRANKDAFETESIIVCIPATAGQSPNMMVTYHEEEVR